MGEIIPFSLKSRRNIKDFSNRSINDLLERAVILREKVFGEMQNGIYHPRADLKEILTAKICSILLKEKMVRNDLFQCSLYLAQTMAGIVNKAPRSYYVVDYFTEGFEKNNPLVIKEGADYCAIVCIFFEGRRGWRAMRPKDYERMGSGLYHAYYDLSGKPIGWHMSKNFKQIIPIAKRSIENLKN